MTCCEGGSASLSTDVSALEAIVKALRTPGMHDGHVELDVDPTRDLVACPGSVISALLRHAVGQVLARGVAVGLLLLACRVGSVASSRAPSRAAWPASMYV